MKISQVLRSLSAYPTPSYVVERIMIQRNLQDIDFSADVAEGRSYNLAVADMYWWYTTAPDVSQEWVNFSFTQEEKLMFERRARAIYRQYNEPIPETQSKGVYGYKGSTL